LAAEQDLLQNVYEANGCENFVKKHNLWIDAGIMPSHIGFESAIGKDCATLTEVFWLIIRIMKLELKFDIHQKTKKWYLVYVFKRLATHPEN
jgi:hypothetical protein